MSYYITGTMASTSSQVQATNTSPVQHQLHANTNVDEIIGRDGRTVEGDGPLTKGDGPLTTVIESFGATGTVVKCFGSPEAEGTKRDNSILSIEEVSEMKLSMGEHHVGEHHVLQIEETIEGEHAVGEYPDSEIEETLLGEETIAGEGVVLPGEETIAGEGVVVSAEDNPPNPDEQKGEEIVQSPNSGHSQEMVQSLNFDPFCRICQWETQEVLIHLGCACQGEVGMAHRSCIERWFTIIGTNICEICQSHASLVPLPVMAEGLAANGTGIPVVAMSRSGPPPSWERLQRNKWILFLIFVGLQMYVVNFLVRSFSHESVLSALVLAASTPAAMGIVVLLVILIRELVTRYWIWRG